MGFDNFLRKMGKQTNPSLEEERRPAQRVVIEEEIEEEVDPSDIYEREDRSREERKKEEKTILTEEEIVEKALDYARSVVKVVRQNFDSERERKIFYEAVRSAVTMCLGDSQPRMIVAPQPQPVIQKGKKGKKEAQQASAVSGYDLDGMDITEQVRKAAEQSPLNLEEVEDFNITRKVNSRGEVEADISGMTAEDIKAFKILAGVEQVNG